MSAEFVTPPRLAVGSHPQSRTYMCAMNVISWERGDDYLTDTPSCSPAALSGMVQLVNDRCCAHTTAETDPDTGDDVRVLCAPCSVKVLRLAHRTVDAPQLSRPQMWGWTADLLTRSTSHLRGHDELMTIRAAEKVARAHAEGHTPDPSRLPSSGTTTPMVQLATMILASERVNRARPILAPASFPVGATFDEVHEFLTMDKLLTQPVGFTITGSMMRPPSIIVGMAGRMYVGGNSYFLPQNDTLIDRAHEAINVYVGQDCAPVRNLCMTEAATA